MSGGGFRQLPTIESERTVRAAEHEVWLSFAEDADAEMFVDWWGTKGWQGFAAWVVAHEEDYA